MEKVICNKHTIALATKQAILQLKETHFRLNKVVDILKISDEEKEKERKKLKESYDSYLKYLQNLS